MVVSVTQTFAARALDLQGIVGSVQVDVHSGDGIEYTASGTDRLVEALRTEVATGGILCVELVLPSPHKVDGGDRLDIVLKVPLGTPISIKRHVGTIRIGDTEGTLTVFMQAGTLVTGHVKDPRVSLAAGTASLAQVTGTANLAVNGAGQIAVEAGAITLLEAGIKGAGSIDVNAPADDAEVTVTGVGIVTVAHIRGELRQHRSGLGRIQVGRRG